MPIQKGAVAYCRQYWSPHYAVTGKEMIPDYARDHVLYAKLPDGCCVPKDSIPAVAEGHLTYARAANVGINPHGA